MNDEQFKLIDEMHKNFNIASDNAQFLLNLTGILIKLCEPSSDDTVEVMVFKDQLIEKIKYHLRQLTLAEKIHINDIEGLP